MIDGRGGVNIEHLFFMTENASSHYPFGDTDLSSNDVIKAN
jgi:hypothetical protein